MAGSQTSDVSSDVSAVTLRTLQRCALHELEELFCRPGRVAVPAGRYRGVHLTRLPTAGAQVPFNRLFGFVGFEAAPFGIDFHHNRWYFFHSALRIGRFRPVAGRSRWRDTEAVCLHYENSRIPAVIRDALYDEVKPLSAGLCLGLGGLNAERGEGDQFYFALARVE